MPKQKNNSKSLTIKDIAKAAGVSISTVSKVMNSTGSISQRTRDRISAVISELDYRPSEIARSLQQKKTYTIGLVSTDDYGRFSLPILKGIENALLEAQISVFLCNASGSSQELERHVNSLLAKRVDGIIVTADKTNTRTPLELYGTPVVYAYTNVADENELCVLPDDYSAGVLACRHLLEQGCRNIVHISGPAHYLAVQQRDEGYRQTFGKERLPAGLTRCGPWTSIHGYTAMQAMLKQFPGLDGVITGNDLIGHGALQALYEGGKSVPGDVAVVSFDNWQIITELCRPTLSSIDFCLTELGQIAGKCLIKKIDGENLKGKIIVPCYLQIGESSCRRSQN